MRGIQGSIYATDWTEGRTDGRSHLWSGGLGDSATLIWVGGSEVLCFWFRNGRTLVLFCACVVVPERQVHIHSQQEPLAFAQSATKPETVCVRAPRGPQQSAQRPLRGPASSTPHPPSMEYGYRDGFKGAKKTFWHYGPIRSALFTNKKRRFTTFSHQVIIERLLMSISSSCSTYAPRIQKAERKRVREFVPRGCSFSHPQNSAI